MSTHSLFSWRKKKQYFSFKKSALSGVMDCSDAQTDDEFSLVAHVSRYIITLRLTYDLARIWFSCLYK